MLGDDATHDREPETTATTLGRVIRKKQLLAFARWDARAIIRHRDADEAIRWIVPGLENDSPMPVRRFDGIVDEVDHDAPHLLGIDAYLWEHVRETALEPQVREQ